MFKDVILNISLWIALSYALSLTYSSSKQFMTRASPDSHWLFLSLAPVLLMNFPISISEGIFVDLRVLPLLLMGLRFNATWLTLGLLPAVAYRLYLGGSGTATGIFSLLGVALIAQWLRRSPEVRQQAQMYSVPLRKVLVALLPNALLLPLLRHDLSMYVTVYLPLLLLCALAYVIAASMIHDRYRLLQLVALYENQAHHDVLSRLPNRRQFDADLRLLGPEDVLCLIDIDHFKGVNDRYGHQVGDEVLRQVADAISSSLRRNDRAYRYGGEEFAAIFRNASQADPFALGERIRRRVGHLQIEALQGASITVSVGIVPGGLGTPELCFAQADQNLYHAKQHGRDQTVASGTSSLEGTGPLEGRGPLEGQAGPLSAASGLTGDAPAGVPGQVPVERRTGGGPPLPLPALPDERPRPADLPPCISIRAAKATS